MALPSRITSLALVILVAVPAFADEQPNEYVTAIDRAVIEFRAGNWAEAASHFERAHALHPSARTQRGLGLAYFENHQYVKALEHLRAAMIDTRMPLTEEQRRELFETLEDAERSVARFKIALTPRTAELRVDGSVVRTDEGLLALDPGEHELVASCEHCRTERRTVAAAPGRNDELSFVLRPERQDDDQRANDSASVPRRRFRRILGASLLTLGAASFAGGIAFYRRHNIDGDDLRESPRESALYAQRLQDWENSRSTPYTFAALGTAAITGGTIALLLSSRPERVPWWASMWSAVAAVGLVSWGIADVARGGPCEQSTHDRRSCSDDQEVRDRGALALLAAVPLLALPATQLLRRASTVKEQSSQLSPNAMLHLSHGAASVMLRVNCL